MMRKRSPYGHQRNNNNRGGGNGQMRRHHRRGPGNNTQYEQGDDESVSPRLRRHAQVQREKYVNMAIDARRSGDRVQAEYWLQHADHYQRILNLAQEQFSARGPNMEDGDDTQGDGLNEEQQSSPASSYQQRGANHHYNNETESAGEDEAYEPSYGNPAPVSPPRRQRHQHHRQQRQAQPQPQAEIGGGLEDVLPMPKPERRNDRFGQDQDEE